MKSYKLLSALMVLAGGALASQFATAATTGTITFNGALVADTCDVNGGPSGTDLTVTLPSVQTSTLAAAGQTAGETPFQLVLANCSKTVPVRAYFVPTVMGITDNRLNNTGLASNVQVELLNSLDAPIQLSAVDAPTQGDTLLQTDANGSATLKYKARYYATGTTSAGSVLSSVVYQIIYN